MIVERLAHEGCFSRTAGRCWLASGLVCVCLRVVSLVGHFANRQTGCPVACHGFLSRPWSSLASSNCVRRVRRIPFGARTTGRRTNAHGPQLSSGSPPLPACPARQTAAGPALSPCYDDQRAPFGRMKFITLEARAPVRDTFVRPAHSRERPAGALNRSDRSFGRGGQIDNSLCCFQKPPSPLLLPRVPVRLAQMARVVGRQKLAVHEPIRGGGAAKGAP